LSLRRILAELPGRRYPSATYLRFVISTSYELARADEVLDTPWAVFRYGRLCHQYEAEGMRANRAYSVTKTLGALVTGVVAFQTKDLPRTGRKTGPLTDLDPVAHWLDHFPYNRDARIGHVLGMVAHSENLDLKEMVYDIFGKTQINSLSDVLNTAIRQDRARLGANLDEFTQRFLFQKLGLQRSSWSGGDEDKVFAYSYKADVHDMGKLGWLMMRNGVWAGERLVDADWIYRMTHPSFEEENTAYGYLTWLNAPVNYHFGGIPAPPPDRSQGATLPGPCAPMAINRSHPHGLSASSDCNLGDDARCKQDFDVGVWNAIGLGGQIIQGHPGLDLLIVATDLTPFDTGLRASAMVWDAVRPAVVAGDPNFSLDPEAFCRAYGGNQYAPDLRSSP
jgi:hypothetical protein